VRMAAGIGRREAAVVVFLLRTGLRVAEFCALRREQVAWCEKMRPAVMLDAGQAKGRRPRLVEISADAGRAMEEYWEEEKGRGMIWLGRGGLARNERGGGNLTVRGVQRMVEHVGRLAGVEWVTPHSLRHTLATRMVEVAPVTVVQQMLGHADLRTTQLYVTTSREQVRRALAKVVRMAIGDGDGKGGGGYNVG